MWLDPERRGKTRELLVADIVIEWNDSDGSRRASDVHSANVSSLGIAAVVSEQIPVRARVSVWFPKLARGGAGIVRHSTPFRHGFLIGISLKEGLGSE